MWDRIINVDLRSVFVVHESRDPAAARAGRRRHRQHLIRCRHQGFAGGAAYGAAKHGVIGLTKCAALDYASSNIRINAICPGIIETDMMDRFTGGTETGAPEVIGQEPIGRMGHPDEIAAAVAWLCSDEAAFAIGHALVIDGGQTV